MLLFNSGLRPGEALAARWSDLEGDTLRVSQVLQRTNKGGYVVIENKAKTRKSLRAVTLPSSVLEALKTHRAAQAKEMMKYGPNYKRNDFIFAAKLGSFLDPNNIRNRFKTALKQAGLPEIVRLYDTRHSHATALLNAGVNLAWVSDRLGHSSTKVTEQVYTRVMPEAHRQMAATMEDVLATARAKKAASR
jgi:integrase